MAIYDLTKDGDLDKCKKRLNYFYKNEKIVELLESKEDGSDRQRKYFHSILNIVAREKGYYFDEFKEAVITHLGYYNEILGEKVRLKTTKMKTDTYTKLIDDYRIWAETEEGMYLETPEEYYERMGL